MKAKKDAAKTPLKKPKIVRFLGKLFFGAFFLVISYMVVMAVGMAVPIVISYMFRAFGYTMETMGEAFLGGCACLFILAWLFVITYVSVKKLWGVFLKQIKKLDDPAEKDGD